MEEQAKNNKTKERFGIIKKLKSLFGSDAPAPYIAASQVMNFLFSPNLFASSSTAFSFIYHNLFTTNPDVFACIARIMQACKGIPFVLKEYSGKRWKVIKDPENNLIKILNNPNPMMSGGRFREAIAAFYLLSGVVYVLKTGGRSNFELWLLPPQNMEVEWGEGLGEIKRFIYHSKAGDIEYSPDEIRMITFFNPISMFEGFSPLAPAIMSAAMGNEARRWNISLLKNNCRVPAVLKTDHHLSEQQIKQYKKILEEDYSGAANAGKMLVLTGGFDIKEFSYNPKDLDWSISIGLSTQEICRVLGVPPDIIGRSESTNYYGYPQARISFYHETVLNIMDSICEELTSFIIKDNPRLKIDYDRDGIEALSADRKDLWARVREGVSYGLISPSEAAEILGLAPPEDENANKLYMTRNLAPIESLGLVGSVADNIPPKPKLEEEESEQTENREEEEYANSRRAGKETASNNR